MRPPVILLPLDGSPQAEAALPEAEATARATGHNLRLLGIVDRPLAPVAIDGRGTALALDVAALRQREELEDYLHGMARSLQQRGVMTEVLVVGGERRAALQAAIAAPEVRFAVLPRPHAWQVDAACRCTSLATEPFSRRPCPGLEGTTFSRENRAIRADEITP